MKPLAGALTAPEEAAPMAPTAGPVEQVPLAGRAHALSPQRESLPPDEKEHR
jgi:hypothetical protein